MMGDYFSQIMKHIKPQIQCISQTAENQKEHLEGNQRRSTYISKESVKQNYVSYKTME